MGNGSELVRQQRLNGLRNWLHSNGYRYRGNNLFDHKATSSQLQIDPITLWFNRHKVGTTTAMGNSPDRDKAFAELLNHLGINRDVVDAMAEASTWPVVDQKAQMSAFVQTWMDGHPEEAKIQKLFSDAVQDKDDGKPVSAEAVGANATFLRLPDEIWSNPLLDYVMS